MHLNLHMALQAHKDYTHFEIELYFNDLILMKIAGISLLAALGMSIQVFFRNRYFAFFTVVFIILGIPLILKAFKYSNDLFDFNSSGELMKYSDMNGHGHTLPNYFIHKGYWIGWMLILLCMQLLMFPRGKEQGFILRFKAL